MKKRLQMLKDPKWIAIIVAVIAALLLLFYWQRTVAMSRAIEVKLEDWERGGPVKSLFYSDQLNDDETAAYALLTERLDNLEGGVVEFSEPLTGKEFQRVSMTLEDEGYNYFYGFCEIPMSEDNVYLKYSRDDITSVVKPEIAKAVLFLSCAEGINESAEYAKDGTIENLDSVGKSLAQNDPAEEEKIKSRQEETEKVLSGILEGLPDDYGEKSAVDYFLNWLDENMTLTTDASAEGASYSSMKDLLDGVFLYNSVASVVDKKANVTGYAKILSELCNRAGMESHIVFGTWGRKGLTSESYVLCAVRMNDQMIYVDASGAQSGDMGRMRYMTEVGAQNHMEFAEYFSYE